MENLQHKALIEGLKIEGIVNPDTQQTILIQRTITSNPQEFAKVVDPGDPLSEQIRTIMLHGKKWKERCLAAEAAILELRGKVIAGKINDCDAYYVWRAMKQNLELHKEFQPW